MPQAVARPMDTKLLRQHRRLASDAGPNTHWPRLRAVRRKPRLQIRLDWHKATLCGLGLLCLDLNEPLSKANVLPFQAQNLRVAKPRKGADGKEWYQVRFRLRDYHREVCGAEYLNLSAVILCAGQRVGFRGAITQEIPALPRKSPERYNETPVVVPRAQGTGQRPQPVLKLALRH